jgi:signal transduction histidine kinase
MYETVSDALLRLALADAKAGLPVLVPVRVEVLPFLCSFADLLWHAFDRRLAVVLHVDSQCPPWWVDPDALEEALLRLVLQARADAPPIGRMVFRVVAPADGENGHFLMLEAMTRAGEIAFPCELHVDGAQFPKTSGRAPVPSGGLSKLNDFAAQSGGWLRVDSAPGRGTSVSLWLPAFDFSGVQGRAIG